jgi:hypothetical protein
MTLETVRLQLLLVGAFLTAAPAQGELIGTVRTVDPPMRTCTVVTGVGHALRVVSVVIEADTRVTRQGAEIAVADLKPGTIVRISYRTEAGRKRCSAIEAQEKS